VHMFSIVFVLTSRSFSTVQYMRITTTWLTFTHHKSEQSRDACFQIFCHTRPFEPFLLLCTVEIIRARSSTAEGGRQKDVCPLSTLGQSMIHRLPPWRERRVPFVQACPGSSRPMRILIRSRSNKFYLSQFLIPILDNSICAIAVAPRTYHTLFSILTVQQYVRATFQIRPEIRPTHFYRPFHLFSSSEGPTDI
jgi:hypothetical protein